MATVFDDMAQSDQYLAEQDVLAEIEPFLESIGRRDARDFVRHLAVSGTLPNRQFPTSPVALGARNKRIPTSYSDTRVFPPPLHPSVYLGRPPSIIVDLVGIILGSGIKIDHGDAQGNSPLHNVIKSIYRLEEKISSFDAGLEDRCLLEAQLGYVFHVFETLLAAGAPVNGYGSGGESPLHIVCGSPSSGKYHTQTGRVFEALLAAGAKADARDDYDMTPLHIAAETHCVWQVQRLVELGADPNARDALEDTPLTSAVSTDFYSP